MTNLIKKFDQNGIGTMTESSTIDFRKLKNFDQFGKKFDQNGRGTMSESSTIDFRKLKKFDQFGKKI